MKKKSNSIKVNRIHLGDVDVRIKIVDPECVTANIDDDNYYLLKAFFELRRELRRRGLLQVKDKEE